MASKTLEPRDAVLDLARIVERAETASFQDALEGDVTSRFYDGVRETYDIESDPISRAWPELSRSYKQWKSNHYPGRPILVLTGEMRRSATGEYPADRRIEPREATYWVVALDDDYDNYAPYHQFGERWFFGANEDTKSEIEELIADAFAAMID